MILGRVVMLRVLMLALDPNEAFYDFTQGVA